MKFGKRMGSRMKKIGVLLPTYNQLSLFVLFFYRLPSPSCPHQCRTSLRIHEDHGQYPPNQIHLLKRGENERGGHQDCTLQEVLIFMFLADLASTTCSICMIAVLLSPIFLSFSFSRRNLQMTKNEITPHCQQYFPPLQSRQRIQGK